MAIPTAVNGQITDAVTQSNVKVLGDAPAYAMGALYQSLAHSTGILYENATSAQQQLAINTLHDERLIWYDECGLWTVCQSALDAWRQGNRTVHRRLKVDRRNYHGKPREQSKRRGIPAGAANSVYATNLS